MATWYNSDRSGNGLHLDTVVNHVPTEINGYGYEVASVADKAMRFLLANDNNWFMYRDEGDGNNVWGVTAGSAISTFIIETVFRVSASSCWNTNYNHWRLLSIRDLDAGDLEFYNLSNDDGSGGDYDISNLRFWNGGSNYAQISHDLDDPVSHWIYNVIVFDSGNTIGGQNYWGAWGDLTDADANLTTSTTRALNLNSTTTETANADSWIIFGHCSNTEFVHSGAYLDLSAVRVGKFTTGTYTDTILQTRFDAIKNAANWSTPDGPFDPNSSTIPSGDTTTFLLTGNTDSGGSTLTKHWHHKDKNMCFKDHSCGLIKPTLREVINVNTWR